MDGLFDLALWAMILCAALMAGIYFAFSAFVMRSLDALEVAEAIRAMQSINRVILRSPFLPIFFASSILSAAVAALAVFRWQELSGLWAALGGATYFIGMFVVTVLRNVPLNDRLEAIDADADGEKAASFWRIYLSRWTAWNHVRTAACLISLVFLIMAIMARN